MPVTFKCTIVTPEARILDEDVIYTSIPSHDGQIGVAPQRAPLLVKLADGPLRIDDAQGESRWFFVVGGFAQMLDDKLTVLTLEAVPVDQIDRQEAEAALAQALSTKAHSDDEVMQKYQRQTRARALISLGARKPG